MKELLIIFVVLLVLLLLISTFGGSIRQKESFVQITTDESSRFPRPTPVSKPPSAFELPNLPTPDLTPLPSNPPFDTPAPPITDLKKMNIEPFQNSSLIQYAQV